MPLTALSLNTLRAFDAAARHLNFTRAADELCVTQAAVSHQVKSLEDYAGKALFRRTARGLVLTDEGALLAPTVDDAFQRIERLLQTFRQGGPQAVLTVGVVGTFAVGFLMPRLADFRARHPHIELRLLTNNNKVDLAAESLDFAIRFGDGAWRSVQADMLMRAPLAPLCAPADAAKLRHPDDLSKLTLLRSYRAQDWQAWLRAAGASSITPHGPLFDTSTLMVHAAQLGEGVALAPPCMFVRELQQGRLAQPFALEVDVGGYWLTRLLSKEPTAAMAAFRAWLLVQLGVSQQNQAGQVVR
ncbi:MAG: LysR family transcriptional regulator [Burkholderiales bacterium PBB3]|nr:MAG: LysR family transcriptional regulator [Burkholderiales bacterium PBB3]